LTGSVLGEGEVMLSAMHEKISI